MIVSESDPDIDMILAEQLGSLGHAAAPTGGALSERSTAWTAKRLKTETASQQRRFDPQRGTEVVDALARMLGGTPEYGTPGDQASSRTVRGIVGSGFFGMNPSYVLAVVDPRQGTLAVAAHAKEGLIKQRSAQKAVHKVLTDLPLL